MTTFFIARIGDQLIALDRTAVAGVVAGNTPVQPVEESGQMVLQVSGGRKAVVVDLAELFGLPGGLQKYSCYCVLEVQGRYLALPMRGSGRLAVMLSGDLLPLPTALYGPVRELIPGVLVNGRDTLPVVDETVLARAVS